MNFTYFYVDLKIFFMIEIEVLLFMGNKSLVRFYWHHLYIFPVGDNFYCVYHCISYTHFLMKCLHQPTGLTTRTVSYTMHIIHCSSVLELHKLSAKKCSQLNPWLSIVLSVCVISFLCFVEFIFTHNIPVINVKDPSFIINKICLSKVPV